MIFSASISTSRARTDCVSFTWASAPGSWASSTLVSWRISRSPRVTFPPGSKAISTTFADSSAATVTPWTAVSEPTADREVSQDSERAAAVVTVSGGRTAFFPCSIIARICKVLTAASTAMTITRPRMANRMRFFIVGPLRRGDFQASNTFLSCRFPVHGSTTRHRAPGKAPRCRQTARPAPGPGGSAPEGTGAAR